MRSDFYLPNELPMPFQEADPTEVVEAPVAGTLLLDRRTSRHPRRAVPVFLLFLLILALGVGAFAYLTYREDQTPPPAPTQSASPKTTLPVLSPPGEELFFLSTGEGNTLTPAQIYDRVNPAVVSILADLGNGMASSGTGVAFDSRGYLVTNAHIIEGAQSAVVTLTSGESCPAFLIGMDTDTDLAVLKISPQGTLPTAVFGGDTDLSVGDPAYAIGNPLGSQFQGSMTEGIISAINRNVTVGESEMTLIQTSAALNSGSSGGALLNDRGQVVGITNMKMMSTASTVEALGFAIPSATVERIVNSILLTGRAVGDPVLGIVVRPATPEESTQGGLMVVEVDPNSDAWAKGLRPGNLLLRANGILLLVNEDLLILRTGLDIGDTLELTWLADDTPMLHVESVALVDDNLLSE